MSGLKKEVVNAITEVEKKEGLKEKETKKDLEYIQEPTFVNSEYMDLRLKVDRARQYLQQWVKDHLGWNQIWDTEYNGRLYVERDKQYGEMRRQLSLTPIWLDQYKKPIWPNPPSKDVSTETIASSAFHDEL